MIAAAVQKALEEKKTRDKESQGQEESREESGSSKSSPHKNEKSLQYSKNVTFVGEFQELRDKIKNQKVK